MAKPLHHLLRERRKNPGSTGSTPATWKLHKDDPRAYEHENCGSPTPAAACVAVKNKQLAELLMEKFLLLSLESMITKETFIFFVLARSPGWSSALSDILGKHGVALCRAKLNYHTSGCHKAAYQRALDEILDVFLANEIERDGVDGVDAKLALLSAISEFDRTILRD